MSAVARVDLEPRRRLRIVPDPPSLPKPPPPPPETLKGIGEGIYDIQRQQARDTRKLDELGLDVADLKSSVVNHGREIRSLTKTVEEHGDRIVELERLPRARPQHPVPPSLEHYDPEQTAGGGIRVESAKWAAMEAAFSQLRERLDSSEQREAIETARADEADRVRDEIAAKAERDRQAWDRRLRWAIAIGGAVATATGALVWLLAHVLH